MTDLFISYSRKDQDFVRRLHGALAARDKEAWVDWEDIPASAKWLDELRGAIEGSDAFAFVISPESVVSAFCRQEAEHALALGKRIIPILRADADASLVPEGVAAHNWIELREGDDFDAGVDTLVRALDTDLEWTKAHTRLLTRALEWERATRDPSFLLRGRDLDAAEGWLTSGTETRDPRPTPLQTEYAIASRRASTRGQRVRVGALSVGLVVALGLTAFSLIQLNEAVAQRTRAEAQTRIATARELAQASGNQLKLDPELSLLLAVKAVEAAATVETDQALRVAIQASRVRANVSTGRPIDHAAINGDLTRLVTSQPDGSVFLVDPASGAILSRLGEPGTPVLAVAIDAAGARAVAGTGDGIIRVWENGVATPARQFETGSQSITTIAFDQSGRLVVVVGKDGVAELRDASDGTFIRSFETRGDELSSATFSPDGSTVVIGGTGGRIYSYDAASGEFTRLLEGQKGTILSLAWSQDGNLLVSTCTDGTARIWDARTGVRLAETTSSTSAGSLAAEVLGHGGLVTGAAFDPSSSKLLTTSDDATGIVWTAGTAAPIAVLARHQAPTLVGGFSPDGREVVTVATDGTIRTWTATATDPVRRLTPGNADRIVAFAYSPDDTRFAAVGIDGEARLWTADWQLIAKLKTHEPFMEALAWSPDGRTLATTSTPGTVRLWDGATGAAGPTMAGPAGPNHPGLSPNMDVVFSGDGTRLFSTSPTDTRIWDAATGAPIGIWQLPATALAMSPDGNTLAVGSTDFGIRLVDPSTGNVRRMLVGHSDALESLRFDHAGAQLLSASADSTARIWDVTPGRQPLVLTSPAHVTSAAWNRDGTRFATSHFDGRARVWDPGTGALLGTYHFDPYAMRAVTFTPDGRHLIGSHLGVGWMVECEICGSADSVLELARSRLTRGFTPAEESQFLHIAHVAPVATAAPSSVPSVTPEPSPSPSVTAEPEPSVAAPSTSPTPGASYDDGSMDLCDADNGACDLATGLYRTRGFEPTLTIRVASGWRLESEARQLVDFTYGEGYLAVLSGVTQGVRYGQSVPIDSGSEAFIDYLGTVPGLVISNTRPITLGRFEGTSVDLAAGGDEQVDLLLVGNGAYSTVPGERIRLLTLDVGDATVIVMIDFVDGDEFDASIGQMEEVVHSIRFP